MITFFRRFEIKMFSLLRQTVGPIFILSILSLLLSLGISRVFSPVGYTVLLYLLSIVIYFYLYGLVIGKQRTQQYLISDVVKQTDIDSFVRFVFITIIRQLPFLAGWGAILITKYFTASLLHTVPVGIIVFCIAVAISSRLLLASAALIDTGNTVDSALNTSIALTKSHQGLTFFLVILYILMTTQITLPYVVLTNMLLLFRCFVVYCSVVIEVALYLTCIDLRRNTL